MKASTNPAVSPERSCDTASVISINVGGQDPCSLIMCVVIAGFFFDKITEIKLDTSGVRIS